MTGSPGAAPEPADSLWWPSPYGAGDRIGAGHELTPEVTLAALRLPRSGQFFPVHQRLLTMAGIYILENIRTSDLVRPDLISH